MKKFLAAFAFAAAMSVGVSASLAAKAAPAKEAAKEAAAPVTLTGTAKCAKCALKETEKCQAALVVKDGDKETTYYVKGAPGAALHKEICQAPKENVTLTGTVAEEGGHKWLVVAAPAKGK